MIFLSATSLLLCGPLESNDPRQSGMLGTASGTSPMDGLRQLPDIIEDVIEVSRRGWWSLARPGMGARASLPDDGQANRMKHRLTRLSRAYAVALRKHLRQGPAANLRPARGWGREALSLGLETLDVARIHAGALARLEASR